MNPANPALPASGLIPYEPAAPFWSDNATKERWLALPNSTSIGVGSDGDLNFPNGTVLVKHFRLGGALIETRLFMRHPDGDWAGYTYEWNSQRTDATLVQGGKTVSVGSPPQNWIFPSGNDCLTCHTTAAGFSLGLEAAQLNHDFLYSTTGRTANQLRTLDAITMFTTPLGDPALQPSMPDPVRCVGAARAARASLSAHELCPLPPHGRADAELHGPALLDIAVEHERVRCRAAVGRPGARRRSAHHRARRCGELGAAGAHEPARRERHAAARVERRRRRGRRLVQQWIASLTTCQ